MPDFNFGEQLASPCLESSSDTTTGSCSQASKYNKYFWVCILHFPSPQIQAGRKKKIMKENVCMNIFTICSVRKEKNVKSRWLIHGVLVENIAAFKHCLSVAEVLTVNIFHTRCGLKCTWLRIFLYTVTVSSGSPRIPWFQKDCSCCRCPAQGVPAKWTQGLGRLLTPKNLELQIVYKT